MFKSTKKIIALLPMKGHSERVPNKNMRNFYGKPLYQLIMQSLTKSKYVKKIIINTDSEEIARNASENFKDVAIIYRPGHIQGDMVPMNDIIAHDISKAQEDHFLQTHCTNPLLTATTIDRAIENYFNRLDQYDSLFSVTRHQTRLYWKNGTPINHDPQKLIRTQDLEPAYEENSNLYLFSRASFIESGHKRIGSKPQMFEIDKLEAVDIDEEADFKLAEALYSLMHGGRDTCI